MDLNQLNQWMLIILQQTQAAHARILPYLNGFLGILVTIDVLLFGMAIMLGSGRLLGAAFSKILQIGFWVHLLPHWPTLCKTFAEGAIWLGLLGAGAGLTLGEVFNPAVRIRDRTLCQLGNCHDVVTRNVGG